MKVETYIKPVTPLKMPAIAAVSCGRWVYVETTPAPNALWARQRGPENKSVNADVTYAKTVFASYLKPSKNPNSFVPQLKSMNVSRVSSNGRCEKGGGEMCVK